MSLRIVFMGTPEFASFILEHLYGSKIEIAAVVTVADKPAGRGQKMHESPVKQFASSHGIPILQPTNLKDEEFLSELASFKADLFVVVAFRMLPESVWAMPSKGTINFHASLLPQYRGAAPINWAIINGETKTGGTTFFIEKEIDTGMVIRREELEIPADWNLGNLYDALMKLGAKITLETLEAIKNGNFQPIAQNQIENVTLKTAPKLNKENTRLVSKISVEKFHNTVRGLSPYPVAWVKLRNEETHEEKTMKVFETKIHEGEIKKGTWIIDCENGKIELLEVQMEAKKRMKTEDFLRGFNHNGWKIVEN